MKKFFLSLVALILICAVVILTKTFMATSKQVAAVDLPHVDISEDVIERFGASVRFKTISYSIDEEPDSAAFLDFHQFLQESFPLVHEHLELEKISDLSLLYTWRGLDETKKPIILMAHQDVVPVDEQTLAGWEAPPFEGKVTETHVLGRGTMDDKATLMAIFEATELLLEEGFTPNQTIYLAFGHDEEIGGTRGAAKIAEHLQAQGVQAAMTLDEAGVLISGLIPGVEETVALVNLAEKGSATFRLKVETNGGHSSLPPRDNTIGMLAQAIVDLENNQFQYQFVEPVTHQFQYLAPELPFAQRMAFANPWLFKKPVMEALYSRTSIAPTIVNGGVKDNVIPTVAEATINFRIMPGETIETVEDHIRNTISEQVIVEQVGFSTNPSQASSVDSESFRILSTTIRSLFPNSIVMPGLNPGSTDSRYFYPISDDVYRFYPMRVDSEALTRIHGIDEKLARENYKEIIEFTYQLIKQFE